MFKLHQLGGSGIKKKKLPPTSTMSNVLRVLWFARSLGKLQSREKQGNEPNQNGEIKTIFKQTLWLIPPVLLQSGGTWFEACVDWKITCTLPTSFRSPRGPPLSNKTNLFTVIKKKMEFGMTPFSIKTHLQLINSSLSATTALHGLPFSPNETEFICNLQHIAAPRLGASKSSTGTDGISCRLRKEAGSANLFTSLFGWVECQMNGNAPWVISPLFKGGNRDRQEVKKIQTNNYYFPLHRVLQEYNGNTSECTNLYLQDQSLICDEQAEFWSGQSTVTQLCLWCQAGGNWWR